MSEPSPTHPAQEPAPLPRRRRWLIWVRKVLIGLVLGGVGFLFLVYFLLQVPPVQRYVVGKVTQTLSRELETEVHLEAVQLELFDKFILRELEIQDRQGGALLVSGRTEVNFSALIFNLLRKRLVIQDLTLQRARVNWVHPRGATESNLQFVLDYLKGGTTVVKEPPKRPLDLRVKRFFLEDVEFVKLDSVRGSNLSIYVREGDGVLDRFDLLTGQIDFRQLFLDGLAIGVNTFDMDSAAFARLYPEAFDPPPYDPSQPYVGPFAGFPNLCIDILHLRDGRFSLRNPRKEPVRLTSEDILNFNYLDVFNVDIVVRSFSLADDVFHGNIDLMSFRESSGFELECLTAGHATVSGQTVELLDMKLITPQSTLGDTLILTYKQYADFIDFPDAVRLDVRLRESSVWLDDILTFAPALERNPFFLKNRNEVLAIDGQIQGKINSLRGRDLSIRLARNTRIEGNFSSLYLAVPDLASLNLRLDRLETQMSTLRELIPGFNPPANFDRLGRLLFSGSFDGFFSDFVAYGELRTRLGMATMDMKLSGGKEEAKYSGKLALLNFDLKEFTGNDNFGNITFTSQVLDGSGLTGATANARLEAKIDSFYFRDYPYRNLAMEGQLNRNLFDGIFGIQDPNIDFSFNGAIDFTGSIPLFDFSARVRRIDLKKLNLSEKDLILSGKVDLKIRDTDLSKIEGGVSLYDFLLLKDQKQTYTLDSLILSASGSGVSRRLALQSEMMEGAVDGRFNLKELPAIFYQFLNRNYSAFADRLGVPKPEVQPDTSYFHFGLSIHDTHDWLELLVPEMRPVQGGSVEGFFSNRNDSLFLELDLPAVQLGNTVFEDIYLNADAQRDTCVLDLGVFRTKLASGRELAPVSVLGLVNRDTLNFGLTAIDYDRLLNKLEMDGVFFLDEQDFFIRFAESKMVLLNEEWQIRKDNFVRFGKDYIQTRDFVLTSGERHILLQSLDRRGLQLYLRNFNFGDLNSAIDYEPMQFAGGIDLEASIDNLFQFSGLHLAARADSFLINEIDYGALHIEADAEGFKSPFEATATLSKGRQKVKASGFYNPPKYEHDPKNRRHPAQGNYLQARAELADFPLAFLEIWIGAGVSDTEGLVTGSATFAGDPAKLDIRGKATVANGATTIDFLNTRYYIDGQSVQLTSTMIDATGAVLTDQMGNRAEVIGGITHDHLRNMGLDARIRSDNFLMLNTKKGQNELFYGTAIASGNLSFTGPFAKADIYVNATSRSGTHIVLPISSKRTAQEVRYIHFTQRYRKPDPDMLPPQLQEEIGLNVEMDLNITDDAVIEMIFDEQAGDILRGRGNGTIQMKVPRTGDFLMYGEYVVTSGDYLFTLMNLVNKPFVVRRGGTIRWSGDPFGAKINIDAEYKDLKATLTNFLAEYLITESDPQVKQAARAQTEVDLVMNLSGDLLKPNVAFDIQFPKVINALREYTDSKLRILRQDQNEMNRQVFGLIVIGQFLPAQNALQGQELAIGINTLTEMLSQQLSLYLTGLVSEWLSEDGLISGIDFDIAYSYIQGTDLNNPDELYRTNELQVRLKNYLFNDRLTVNVGGNFDLSGQNNLLTGGTTNSGVFWAGDLAVEYLLTKDQTLKIRFYQSTEPEIGGGRRNRTGLGLSFRKEFDTFEEFVDGLRFTTKQLKGS